MLRKEGDLFVKKIMWLFLATVICVLTIFPVKARAERLTIGKEYETYVKPYEDEEEYSFKVAIPGKYIITIDYVGVDRDDDAGGSGNINNGDNHAGASSAIPPEYDEDDMEDEMQPLEFFVDGGSRAFDDFKVEYGQKKSFSMIFDKGTYIIAFDDLDCLEELYYSIKIVRDGKDIPFSKVSKRLSKSKKSFAKYKKTKSSATLTLDKIVSTDFKEEELYFLAVKMTPRIKISKAGASSYMTYGLEGFLLYNGFTGIKDLDVYQIVFGNKKTKQKYTASPISEYNRYNDKERFFEDKCKWKSTMFKSYASSVKDVDKLLKIFKGKKTYMEVKGSHGAHYRMYFTKKGKKEWVHALKTYKKILKTYK